MMVESIDSVREVVSTERQEVLGVFGRITRNILLIALILITLNQLIVRVLPVNWGKPIATRKYDYYQTNASDFDTLFIGSSRTRGQISPTIFNAQTNASAFNLGVDGYFFPQTKRLFDDMLASDISLPKTVLFELTLTGQPGPENMHTTEQAYWYTPGYTQLQVRHVFESQQKWGDRAVFVFRHAMSQVEQLFSVGMGLDAINSVQGTQAYLTDENTLGDLRDGFTPFNDRFVELTPARQDFLNEPAIVIQRQAEIMALQGTNTLENTYKPLLSEMLADAEAHGINLIFIMPPRYHSSLLDSIAEGHKIILNDPVAYPQLYDPATSWDVGHLDEAGSTIYTHLVAEQFLAIQKARE